MRLWCIHPCYLDSKGLVACWREGLLARKVLRGETKGYKHHPQLERFRGQPDPAGMIDIYLLAIYREAKKRGFSFDRGKIEPGKSRRRIPVTDGQLEYEFSHLKEKLKKRDLDRCDVLAGVKVPRPHPIFRVTRGEMEPWEKPVRRPRRHPTNISSLGKR